MIFKSQFIHTHLPQQAIDLNRIGNNPFFKTESPCIDKRRYGRVERPTRACVYTLRSIEHMLEPPVGLDRFVAINPRNNRSIVKRRKRSVELQQPVLDFFGQRFGIFIGYVVKSAEYQPLVISICVLATTTYGTCRQKHDQKQNDRPPRTSISFIHNLLKNKCSNKIFTLSLSR